MVVVSNMESGQTPHIAPYARPGLYVPHSSASVPTRHKHEQNMIIYLYITPIVLRWDFAIELHIQCARRSDGDTDTPDCLQDTYWCKCEDGCVKLTP